MLLLFLALLIVSLIIHEAAHAFFMRRHGIEIEEFGIGFGPGIRIPIIDRATGTKKLSLALRVLPLVAYVQPSPQGEKNIAELPLKKYCEILGAGIIANLNIAALLLLGMAGYTWFLLGQLPQSPLGIWTLLAAALLVVVLSWRAPAAMSAFGPSVLGLVGIGLLTYAFAGPFFAEPGASGNPETVGPIGIVQMGSQIRTWYDFVNLLFAVNFGLALMNALPLVPLDGGKMLFAVLEKKFGFTGTKREITEKVSLWAFFSLIIYIITGDIFRLFG